MQLHFDIYAWCAFQVFVFIKLVSNVVLQVRAHIKTGIVGYPEDMKSSTRLGPANPANAFDLSLVRATGLFRNDLENIIPFSLIALAAAFVQVNAQLYVVFICSYVLARIVHAVCLIRGLQPFRTISFLFGNFCALILVVMLVGRLFAIFQTI